MIQNTLAQKLKGIHACSYTRYSSDNQNDTSIEYQDADIGKFCDANGIILDAKYSDIAQTGRTDKREGFQQMIMDLMVHPEWKCVLIYDYSRFARHLQDATHYTERLRAMGVTLISVTEPLANNAEGRFFANIKHSYNQYFSEHLCEVVHSGQFEKASSGRHCGGIPPLGYDVVNERLVINPYEAEIVRFIFSSIEQGVSYLSLSKQLNEQGHRTKVGKPFTKQSFKDLLRQEKYTGIYVWNKTSAKYFNPNSPKGISCNTHRHKPLEEQVRIHDESLRIISDEQFNTVQKLLNDRAHGKASNNGRHHYIFGGLKVLKCRHCGAYLKAKTTVSYGKTYKIYFCPNHSSAPAACPTKSIRETYLSGVVLTKIINKMICRSTLDSLNTALAELPVNPLLLHRRDSLKKKISNMLSSLEKSSSTIAAAHIDELEEELKAVESEIANLSTGSLQLDSQNLLSMKKALYSHLKSANDVDTRRFLSTIIKEIVVDNDNISFTLNID